MPYNSGSIANFSSSAISDTYQRIVQTDGTYLADGTGSLINNITIPGNLIVSGTLYAENTVVVTQSFSSGSNILGDAVDDFQTLYGTVRIPTGSLTVTGSITSTDTITSTALYPNLIGFATSGSWASGAGFHSNTWRGTYTGATYGFVSNAYTSSVANFVLAGTRPINPNFAQFQLYVKTDNTTVLDVGGGGPILDIANNGTSYARFDGSNFSIGATSALSKAYISGSSSQALLRIDSSASSSILFVSGSGQVGIGTSTPNITTRLHVVAPAGADAIHTNGTIYFTDSTKYLYWQGGSYVGKSEHYFGASNYQWKSFDGATIITRMNINASSGNVGVGMQATAPSARLQVRGSGTTSATTAFRVEDANTSASLVVLDNGNVGIGTSTPSSSLHINTSSPVISFGVFPQFTQIYGASQSDLNNPSSNAHSIVFKSNQTSNGYGFYFRQTNSNNNASWISGTGGTLNLTSGGFFPVSSGSGTYRHVDIAYALNGTNGAQTGTGYGIYLNATETTLNGLTSALIDLRSNNTSRFTVLGTGNVGIGTTTPAYNLDVIGNARIGANSNSSTNVTVEVTAGGGGNNALIDYGYFSTFDASIWKAGYFGSDGGKFKIQSTVTGNAFDVFVLNGTSTFSFLTGSVGIGITTPTAKLHVSGSPGTGSAVAIYKSGSNVLSIDGSSGRLFSVDDSLSGSLFSVNTAAGLPTIEAFSDNTVNIGKYNVYPIKVVSNGTAAAITGSFSGSIRATSITLTGSLNVSGSQNYVGDVNILGTLTATVKSFLIEHPTQPGKKLQYGNLEGPEHAVYFRGRSTSSIIEFPEEWAGLVNEETVTVQLTPVGGYQPLYVSNITSTRVEIQVAQPMALNYHYLIHGERKDIDKLITTVN